MSLADVKSTYEKLGHEDPLYAVLSFRGRRRNRWDPAEFFRTGEREIDEALRYVEGLGLRLSHKRALDFGCGVGRLSQALADHFEEVVGVDIAESMVETAYRYNKHGDRVRYLVNTADHLKLLSGDSFDFVYTNKTLQHIPPEVARQYIREFFRVLRPGGVALFQVPNGRPFAPGSLGAWVYNVRRRRLRRIWKILRGRPPVEMHYIAGGEVRCLVEESGGRVVDVVDIAEGRKRGLNLRYCAVKYPCGPSILT